MPKVTGPLFSLKAQGQFGKSLIFKRGGVVVNYFKPRNPNSAAQQAQREAFKELYVMGLTQEQADLLYAAILHEHDDLYSQLGHGHALSEVSNLALFLEKTSGAGGRMTWNSTTGYQIEPGRAVVNGAVLSWNSAVARASLSLANSTLYYVYLYSNSGSAALEESTTVPVWNNDLNCYTKTGDTSRMCIGFISTNSTGGIRKFLNSIIGRISEFIYIDGVDFGTSKRPVNAGTASAWTSFSLAPLVPAHATHAYFNPKVSFQASGDDGIIGLSPVSLGSSAANESPFCVRDRGGAVGTATFTGTTWLPISETQTYYYRLMIISGTPLASVEVHGARILR